MSQPLSGRNIRNNTDVINVASFFFISHDIYIYDSSVFQTWEQHLWHQCFSDITAIFMTSVFFPDMTSTLMTSVYFSHDIYINDISVFQTFQQHLWHQCYSDMTSTFMTSVFFLDMTYTFMTSVYFSHDMHIPDIINVDAIWKYTDAIDADVMSEKHWWHTCWSSV
jgi:hypothetical protein